MFSFKNKRSKKESPPHSDGSTFTRRALFIGGVQIILGASLMGRLAYLGSSRQSTYKALSDENRIRVKFDMPKRGLIYDRNNLLLADNQQTYRLMITPDQCVSIKDTIKALSVFYPIDLEDMEEIIKRIRFKPKFMPSSISEGIPWKDVCRLEMILCDFPGCFIEQGWSRHYPNGYATAHLIGYVQTPAKDDKNNSPIYRLSDFRLGKTGVEKTFDTSLRGSVGIKRLEVNARGKTVKNLESRPSISGHEHQLSIDLTLQSYVQHRLSKIQSGSAIVMDIHSGEILSMVSAPSFDANLFTNGIRSKEWKQLLHNPYGCLHNKALHGLYPPGSLFKMVVALAAFESGLVSHSHTCHCKGYIDIGRHRFHCWHKRGGHGKVSIIKALYQSCDVYFYEIAEIIGPEAIRLMSLQMGFGQRTGVELPHEKSGLIPDDSWMGRQRGRKWMTGDTLNMSIGQGALLTTPLQLTLMTARLAHPKGLAITPTLIPGKKKEFESLNLNPESLRLIKQGLSMTVNTPSGLAYKNRIREKGFEMAGKTATCQVRRITMAERKRGITRNDQRPWKHRDHALFSGYAPVNNPKYAVAIVVEHGGAGGKIAAPLGHDILLKTQRALAKNE